MNIKVAVFTVSEQFINTSAIIQSAQLTKMPWLFKQKLQLLWLYSETCHKRSLKNGQNKGLKDRWWLSAGQKYCRMIHLH